MRLNINITINIKTIVSFLIRNILLILILLIIVACGGSGSGGSGNGGSGSGGNSLHQISGIDPDRGFISGGASIRITGSGFEPGIVVNFGTSPCTVTSMSTSLVVCTTSAVSNAGSVDVTIKNIDGAQKILLNGFTFDQLPSPTINSIISPNYALKSGGTSIRINGTGFQPGVTVLLGTFPCAVTTVATEGTSLTCTTPVVGSGAVGLVDVTVKNPDSQQAVLANGFTFNPLLP
ncbi:MAG: IPT/TIG domain-containing protein, partial [Oligoflexia bacterium]|nr:IPT/TIG domain-containing protein [Oligoflexia bacterium]